MPDEKGKMCKEKGYYDCDGQGVSISLGNGKFVKIKTNEEMRGTL